MPNSEAAQKIIIAVLVVAGILLLGPYIGIWPFGHSGYDAQLSQPTSEDDTEQPLARSTPRAHTLDLDLPSDTPSEARRPTSEQADQKLSDIEDLLKNK